MRSRIATASLLALTWLVVLCPPALADSLPDNGEGLLGETDDKVVTFFSLGVLGFFTILVIVATIIQSRLEKRKEEQKASRIRQRIGW